MTRTHRLLLVVLVSVPSIGCGNATTTLFSDGLNIINEVSDGLRKVVDEPSADYFSTARGKNIKDKWENYLKRVDKWIKDKETGDLQTASAFFKTDEWLQKKNKGSGAITHIFRQSSGELDKHFKVWAGKNEVAIDPADPDAMKKAVPLFEKFHTQNEAWFKESYACMRNLKEAQNRIVALSNKDKGAKIKDVASTWKEFLSGQ